MDEQNDAPMVGFKSIQLLKESPLGSGAHGTVCKAKCDELVCAAKILNFLAFQDKDESYGRSLEEECKSLCTFHHPNLIQYLGTWQDPATNLPVLLMELMDHSLTHFLETCQETPPPFHTQVNICHDIALALSFLHSNDIVHRDLSSNNVLMIADRRAKVTDFGMARLVDINLQHGQSSLSKHQGNNAYMPPEAASGSCSNKLDCFSFGVVTIQVLTQQSPQPGDQFKIVYINDPNFPDGIETRATEADRRKNHIDLIATDNPLLPIALTCIKDKEDERPSSKDLCNMLADVKEADQYTDSMTKSSTDKIMDDIEKQVQDIQKLSLLSAEDDVHPDKDSMSPPQQVSATENQDKQVQALQQQIRNMQSKELTATKELESLKTELQVKDSQLQAQASEYKDKLKELQQTISSFTDPTGPMELKRIKLDWSKEFRTPCAMSRTSDGVATTEKVVYLRPGGTREIYAYSTIVEKWSRMVDAPTKECGIAIIRRKLTVIGGQNGDQYSNKLLSLVETAGRKEWIVIYPAMPTKRCSSIIIQCQNSLIVAGGENESGYLKIVEVMNTSTDVWQTVADLPEPLIYASAAHSGDKLYILGGWVEKMTPTYSLLMTTLESLLRSTQTPNVASENGASPSSPTSQDEASPSSSPTPWQELTHLPLKGSTCVCTRGRLIAIGGRDIHKPTSAIHLFNPLSKTWELLAHLGHPRHQSFAVAMEGKLMVVGGYRLNSKQVLAETTVVEVADIVY